MGEAEFPTDCSLMITVADGEYSKTTYPPMAEWRGDILVGKFPMVGIGFSLMAGALQDNMRSICILRGPGNPIAKTNRVEEFVRRDLMRKIESSPYLRKRFGRD
jgi:hypothetical protein